MKKILYVVLDGVGDRPIPVLNDQTTLQAASIPNMDQLARAGQTGLMYTVGEGIAPQSDIAVISILGYDPRVYYTGRGPLESFAAGLQVNPGDVALRCNFATRGEGQTIADRRVGRGLPTEEASVLCRAINAQVKLTSVPNSSFEFLNTVAQRAVLVLRNKDGLSGEITNVDPAYDRIGKLGVAKAAFENVIQHVTPVQGYEHSEKAINAAKLMNEFVEKSSEVLDKHPLNQKRRERGLLAANLILARDAGEGLPNFPPYRERFGLNFATFVEMPVEVGIARLMGIQIVELPQPSSDLGADYRLRAQMAFERLPNYDGIYIHIKGPDEPAHDGDYQRKINIIELIDQHFFGTLSDKINLRETLIVITADHATPCVLKGHSDDPVPLLISGGNLKSDGTPNYSEPACRNGSLGILKNGTELLPLLIRCAKA
jgi:2,3-bisphosphoglycerate-independent phosphoglycerate mutase